ncbi:MAG TPA: hypothetical protein PK990_00755 [Salinivirgaceae bacterium]|nr:hypothetical protein [Salinivirgaceae bacterium]
MLLFFIYLFLVVFLISRIPFFKNSTIRIGFLQIVFVLKVIVGILVLLIYEYYYPSDTADVFNYFRDGKILHDVFFRSPGDFFSILTGIGDNRPHLHQYYNEMSFWIKPFDYNLYNDNKPIIRLHALFHFFSGGNIYVHVIFFNVLSILGLIAMFRFLIRWFDSEKRRVTFLIFLMFTPTIMFWGSGMLKESFLIFVLGFFLWFCGRLLMEPVNLKNVIGLVLFFFLMTRVKIYVLLSLIPALLWLFYQNKFPKFKILSFIGIHLLMVLMVGLWGIILPQYDLVDILVSKQNDFINFTTELAPAGSSVALPRLSKSFWSIISLAPVGFFNSLCRPTIFEAHNLMAFFAALENAVFNLLLLFALIFFRKDALKSPLFLFSISFVAILFVVIGITTPVLGALVRYKLPGLIFFISILMLAFDFSKLSNQRVFSGVINAVNKKFSFLSQWIFQSNGK